MSEDGSSESTTIHSIPDVQRHGKFQTSTNRVHYYKKKKDGQRFTDIIFKTFISFSFSNVAEHGRSGDVHEIRIRSFISVLNTFRCPALYYNSSYIKHTGCAPKSSRIEFQKKCFENVCASTWQSTK